MSLWVPFYASLREGDKRGLPRAVRFVYLELSLLSRSFEGELPLPRGFKSDIDAVHDMLGGKRSEVVVALALLTVPMDPTNPKDEPLLKLAGPPERRVLIVTSFKNYVARDKSAPRMRKLRGKSLEQYHEDIDHGDGTCDGDVTATKERREEDRREEESVIPSHDHRDSFTPDFDAPEPSSAVMPVAAPLRLEPTSGKRIRKAKRVASTIPDDFAVTPAIEAMCRAEGLADPHVVFRTFRDDALAKGRVYADWEAAFRNWMRSPITAREYPPWSEARASSPQETPEQAEARIAAQWAKDCEKYGIDPDAKVDPSEDVDAVLEHASASMRAGAAK